MKISESRVSYWKQINIHNRTAQPNMMRPRVTTADGYTYLVELEIGDPLKTVYLIMDTGSSVTWMQCLPCQECFPQKFDIYDPKNSKTFKKIPCNSPICQSFKCVDQQCLYSVGYMDGDSTEGYAASETIHIKDEQDISVDNKRLNFPPDTFTFKPDTGDGGFLIDSGTILTYIQDTAYSKLEEEIVRYFSPYKQLVRSQDCPAPSKLCYDAPMGFPLFPTITYHFQGANLTIARENSFEVDDEEKSFILSIAPQSSLSILGAYQQHNIRFIFDIDSNGTIKLGPLGGGTGGGGWDFNPGPHSSITEIEIVHGVVVDSIYIKSVNRKTGRSGFSGKHGGNGGGSTLISITEPDEYITSISGTTRTFNGHLVVESLTFNTNKTRYGPYGNTTGNAFGIPMENGEIVGFFGRAGDFIDAIDSTSHLDKFKYSLNIFKPNPYKKKTAQKRRTAQKGRSYVFGIPTPTSPAHHNENHPIFRAGARVPATSSTRDRDIGDPTISHNSKRRSNAWIIFLAIGIFMLLITAYLLCRRKVVPATQNFNIENRLGQGGFGPVYKGTLASGSEMLIVYEFMPNRSLDAHLFDLTNRSVVPLDWETRKKIIKGIARDFGLAKLLKDNQSEANTTTKVGTFGYMAPEYCMGGVISSKSDVYSFGVVQLEIISGLKSLDPRLDCLGLPNHTWELWCRRSGIELMDKAMAQSSVDSEEVLRWIHIGLLCVQEDTGKRPYMSEVLRMLENRNIKLLGPTRPPLSVDQPDLEASQQSSCSTIYLDAEAGLSVDSVNLVTSQSSSNVASNNTPILV
ncbi:hypothetical protein LWI29_033952 [Acer saccharum]|uniref:Peptidase A1 domain-containing protein n=1 Tax=Acer saccharum TaxID=4024 RepID=A0AA39T8N1_ACESA|nr:hypothetical protein LWI29_033952 [Acer saccharum]